MESTTANPQTGIARAEKIDIRVARSVPEVEALRESWAAWPGHRDSDIDFFLMILKSYPEVVRPHVISLYRGREPESIMIGRLEKKQLGFRIGYIWVARPWVRCLTFVYGAIHGDSSLENTESMLREVVACLGQGEADVATFELVPLESSLYRLALKLPRWLSRDTLPAPQGHEILVIPDRIDEIYRRMSSGRRKEIRRNIRRLQSHPAGELEIVCYRTMEDLDILFRDAEEIAQMTYQRGLGVGFADRRDVRDRLELAARKGWLRAYLLYLGDRPCAFWIGTLYNESFVGEYLGYDPEFRQSSVGTVLMMNVIEGFCNRANGDIVKELDFGPGDAEYKEMLCNKKWFEASVLIFSPTLKGLMLKSLRTSMRFVDSSARKLLVATGLFRRLKRAWRDRLADRSKRRQGTGEPNTSSVSNVSPPLARE